MVSCSPWNERLATDFECQLLVQGKPPMGDKSKIFPLAPALDVEKQLTKLKTAKRERDAARAPKEDINHYYGDYYR